MATDEFSAIIQNRIAKSLLINVKDILNKKEAEAATEKLAARTISKIKDKLIDVLDEDPRDTISLSEILASATVRIETELEKTAKGGVARTIKGRFFSLTSLKDILEQKLFATIQSNMGKGNATRVLNYRTGRFAKTVDISRLLMDREGAVVVFYKWMKYPYETFSPGFKQGNIKTRDPVLLIDKSIRQIIEPFVINKIKTLST